MGFKNLVHYRNIVSFCRVGFDVYTYFLPPPRRRLSNRSSWNITNVCRKKKQTSNGNNVIYYYIIFYTLRYTAHYRYASRTTRFCTLWLLPRIKFNFLITNLIFLPVFALVRTFLFIVLFFFFFQSFSFLELQLHYLFYRI